MFNINKLSSSSFINIAVLEKNITDSDLLDLIDLYQNDESDINDYTVGSLLTEKQRFNLLVDICDYTHSSCSNDCPVYELNNSSVPNHTHSSYRCDCFKNGEKMYNFILNKIDIKNI